MLVRIAAFACLGGFLYGYDLGLISGALAPIREELGASEVAVEVMVGAAKFGAIFGTFLGGALMLFYGRRLTIGLDSAFFVLGPIIMAFSAGIVGLTVGRVLIGLGIGVSAVVVPAYLGEVAPARVRGRMVEAYEVMLCLGMLAAMLVDAALQRVPGNWRWMVGAPVLPAFALAMALVVLPESPRWLVVNGRLDEALAVMHRIFTASRLPTGAQASTAEVEQELMELWSAVEKDKAAARERLQAARQRPGLGWRRRLALRGGGGGKWHSLRSPQAAGQAPGGEEQQPLSEAEGRPLRERAAAAGWPVAEPGSSSSSSGPGQQEQASEQRQQAAAEPSSSGSGAEERQEASAGASPSQPAAGGLEPGRGLRVAVSRPQQDGGGGVAAAEGGEAGELREALQDPTSPLYRSLSRIPDGLPPVRTKSGLESSSDITPQSAQQTPRKGELSGRRARSAAQLAAPPRAGAGGAGFWRVFWDMLVDIKAVATGPEAPALQVALWLAFFNQGMASSTIFNYAPELLEQAGVRSHTGSVLLTTTVTAAKIGGVALGVLLIDTLGRRPLLVWGSAGAAGGMVLLFAGALLRSALFEVLAMCVFMFAFSASYAGVFWVLLSELFSMSAKSPAASAATAMLFIAGFLADSLFLTLLRWFGAYSFLVYAAIAAAGGLYSHLRVPETKGRTLAEVQALVAGRLRPGSAAAAAAAAAAAEPRAAPLEPLGQPAREPPVSPSQAGALLAAEEGKEQAPGSSGGGGSGSGGRGLMQRLQERVTGYERQP